MPSFDLPHGTPIGERFSPLDLDRTVIAIPLLKQIQEELRIIEEFNLRFPEAARSHNVAILLSPRDPAGLEAAQARITEMAARAASLALKASTERLKRASAESRSAERKYNRSLQTAIANQEIGQRIEDKFGVFCLASLHSAVIRRLEALNDRMDPSIKPIQRILPKRFEVMIDLNLEHPGGRGAARKWVFDNIETAKKQADVRDAGQNVHFEKSRSSNQYVFARLEARAIQKLVELDIDHAKAKAEKRRELADEASVKAQVDPSRFRAIYHIWPDFEVSTCIERSIATVKADAAQKSFAARGAGITWAVLDSGIDADHPHFRRYNNIDPNSSWHRDFTLDGPGSLEDENGHGTHVAGIIAGEWVVSPDTPEKDRPLAISRYRKQDAEDIEYQEHRLEGISGMAPRCRLVSLKVLDENGKGTVSNLIAAITHVQEINGYGRRLLIQGINMSLGYSFEPEWFACGQSPLCTEVDRLVKSGVVVVVAAGNTGYGALKSAIGSTAAGLALTINDPGNADLAITVGSTHREMPHMYGVSYFSSKGPTGDGRLKPDIVAPGERIISCATGELMRPVGKCDYVESSGTSMAAPHVSGVIAAFLSVRSEFIGQAERVKEIFVSTATDLRRDRYFQGAGLVDLMRAIQSV